MPTQYGAFKQAQCVKQSDGTTQPDLFEVEE